MRKAFIFSVCMVLVCASRPAQAGWWDYVSPSKNWQRIKNCCSKSSESVKTYCNEKVEKAKADQEKTWGLFLPEKVDASRPLVVLIHGLDSNNGVFDAMARLLEKDGLQVGYFSYPSDGPIAGDVNRLAEQMEGVRAKWPGLKIHMIGHSMGAVVARGYIEGDRFAGQVEHFIAIGPPNHGSPWTRQRWLLETNEQYWLWRTNKDWSPIWMFTDGHGEAADDLKPGSVFLTALNDRPRRSGVKYTIVLGNHNVVARFGGEAAGSLENCLPWKNCWGMRQCHAGLCKAQARLMAQAGESDGVVPLESGYLAGVSDVVVKHADHNVLVMGDGKGAPAAWEVVRERLLK